MQLTTEIAMLIASFFAIMAFYAANKMQELTKLKDAYKLKYLCADAAGLDAVEHFGPTDDTIDEAIDELATKIDKMKNVISYMEADRLTTQDMKGLS